MGLKLHTGAESEMSTSEEPLEERTAAVTGSDLLNVLELITSYLETATDTPFCLLGRLSTARVSRTYTSSITMTRFTYFSLCPRSGFKSFTCP